ncbi:cation channel sperm-associated auxiliary subunit delta isoform X8 [Mus musculus]|uniref:cation channel sperm-associated auxiliary subunit delta isoform 2 n=1 Tax=Mus musculus TaxID=10090 RepID=UPI0007EE2431|nr:cation channel sperm-associated auxiliary subunit delta isoform 2 [Mus musculus]XP_030105287.1 cation channel sperm-associated auxiliary subunit delta isoform X8 [Mus musculus]|eukprot:XP_017172689.1 PREDICTED: cation channel sperm-associated protein subunit delta isoform X16 [Mus musculus]
MNTDKLSHLTGTLGGIFHLHSMSQVGVLMVENNLGTFHYMEYPLNHSMGIAFSYKNLLEVIMKPYQRGFMVLWNQKSILVSSNSGQIVEHVRLIDQKIFTDLDVEHANINIYSVASNAYELAFLVAEDHLYYGSQSYMGTYVIKVCLRVWLTLPHQPLWSTHTSIYFEDIGILQVLTPVADPHFAAYDFDKCTVNVQSSLMDEKLALQPCNVMVSNPHALGFKANLNEFGNTFDGNSKYKLDIELKQQHHWGNSDFNFTASKISACTMGILNPVQLQKNYTYTIEKWKNGIVEEIMNAEYVISEINGLVTYSYSLTAATANCRSQPQNWSTFESDIENEEPFLWNRENYVSCHEDNKDNPLLWPNVEYQVLGGQTNNKIIFGQRNGIYTFHLSVVDPYYSYCNLNTIFSVYVHGALPVTKFQPLLTILLMVTTTLLTAWLAYAIPKQLRSEKGQRLLGFCYQILQLCLGVCFCTWLRGKLRQWLRPRRVKDQNRGKVRVAQKHPET